MQGMKKNLLLLGLLLSAFFVQAQKDYKVVFDLTSRDTLDHQSVIRWINGIIKETPDAQLEVVLYGKSLDMITKGKSVVANDVEQLSKNKNVAFKVCAIAMKHNQVEQNQLIPGVQIVPDGIYEIITKQKEGWGYIKAAR
jgi:hypothetical protein